MVITDVAKSGTVTSITIMRQWCIGHTHVILSTDLESTYCYINVSSLSRDTTVMKGFPHLSSLKPYGCLLVAPVHQLSVQYLT